MSLGLWSRCPRSLTRATLLLALVGGVPAGRAAPATGGYIFTYFTKNGEDGLHLAASDDGYHWTKLNNGASYLAPKVGQSKLMRDPCVLLGPDGVFRLVWTSGWTEKGVGYASSRDLIHWSEEKEIPVMAQEPKVRNCWAPEVAYDSKRAEYIIFWSSTIPGRFPATDGTSEAAYNHRIYRTTTKDFATFTPTQLLYDPGFSVIDATFLRALGHLYIVVKDETRSPPRKYLQIARAENDDPQGPFGPLSPPFTPAGLWVEGPTALAVGDSYIVYFDAYQQKHYGAMRSRDLVHWEDVTAQLSFPDEGSNLRMRHGTAIAVTGEILATLRHPAAPAAKPAASPP